MMHFIFILSWWSSGIKHNSVLLKYPCSHLGLGDPHQQCDLLVYKNIFLYFNNTKSLSNRGLTKFGKCQINEELLLATTICSGRLSLSFACNNWLCSEVWHGYQLHSKICHPACFLYIPSFETSFEVEYQSISPMFVHLAFYRWCTGDWSKIQNSLQLHWNT